MKKNDWKDRLNVVYSTNPDFGYEMDNDEEQVTLDKDKQNLRVSIDKKNRGGKVVTLITGFVGTENDLKELGKLLKSKCGTGVAIAGSALSNMFDVRIQKSSKNKGSTDSNKKPTSRNQMQKQVEKGQAPKEVDRVDGAHTEGQQPHVHFKDGTSLNQDGTVHDAHKGTPNLTNSTRKWLEENGWKGN